MGPSSWVNAVGAGRASLIPPVRQPWQGLKNQYLGWGFLVCGGIEASASSLPPCREPPPRCDPTPCRVPVAPLCSSRLLPCMARRVTLRLLSCSALPLFEDAKSANSATFMQRGHVPSLTLITAVGPSVGNSLVKI